MILRTARRRVGVPGGRQPMASMRQSQPKLVCGPCGPIPPKTVLISRTEMAPVPKMRRPVVRILRVSGCIEARLFKVLGIQATRCLVDGGLHDVDDDSGDGDVEPDGEGVAGEALVRGESSGEREEEGDENERKREHRE